MGSEAVACKGCLWFGFVWPPVVFETIVKVTERLSQPLSTSTRNQVSQGGLERAAAQVVPEQLTVTGPRCRETEPMLRTSEQFPPAASSPDEQLATETEREEANSGTYNLKQTRGLRQCRLGGYKHNKGNTTKRLFT